MNGEQVTAVVDAAATTTAEPVGQQPTTGDLYRAWLDAQDEWADAAAWVAEAQQHENTARGKKLAAEQKLGAAVLEGVERDGGYRGRSGFVAMGGRLYYVSETGNEGDGWRYEVRQQVVRKVALPAAAEAEVDESVSKPARKK